MTASTAIKTEEKTRIKHGSPEHFQQVISAHLVGLTGFCRCGAPVSSYREHIAQVWQPHQLPKGWMGR